MRGVLGALASVAFVCTAQAQLVVGNDQSGTATIYEIDVESGAATPIYSGATTTAKPWGMAYDPATNTLYWNNASNLFSSPYGNPLTPSAAIPLTFDGASVNYVAMGFHNGRLLGTRNIATEAVYEIDPVTGVGTQIYVYPMTFDFGGVDVDAASGRLYGLSDSPTGAAGLYEIDNTGMSTTFIAAYPAGETDIDGLAVHNGRAYFVTDGPSTTQASFYVYDVATASQIGTLPSPFTGSGTFSAAAYIAPSSSNGACCAGATCSATPESACTGPNQRFVGGGTTCNAPGNFITPCCTADFNQVGGITVQDIFDFLGAYFTNGAAADINGGGVGVQDIFDYLTVYFRGC